MEHVSEGSTAYLTVVPKNKAGVAQTPTAATYAVHDGNTDEEIQADTALTPGTSMEITLTPAVNTLLSAIEPFEIRVVTVKATYGVDDAVNGVYKYQVDRVEHA